MELKKKAVKGIFYSGLSSILVRVLSLIITIYLSRLLTPEDFGTYGMAVIVINIFAIFQDLGLLTALIYREENIEETASTAFWVLAPLGIIFTAVCWIAAPVFDLIFKGNLDLDVLRFLSLSIFLSTLGNIYIAVLNKKMMFDRLLVPEVISIAVFGISTIFFAHMKLGEWALVYGYFFQTFFNTFFSWLMCGWTQTFVIDKHILKDMLKYGVNVVLTALLLFFSLQSDKLLIGRLIGPVALGLYIMAYNVASGPVIAISQILARVAFPLFSKLQFRLKEFREEFAAMFILNAIFVIPIEAGFFVFIRDIIIVIFTPKWLGMIPILRILCVFGILRAFGNMLGTAFNSIGKPEIVRNLTFTHLVSFFILIFPLAKYCGANGVAFALTIAQFIAIGYGIFVLNKYISIGFKEIGNYIAIPVTGSLFIIVSVYLLKMISIFKAENLINFLTLLVTVSAVYLCTLYLLNRKLISGYITLLKDGFK